MKYILLFFAFVNIAKAGTCTSTTRSNYSSNQVLTSSALNADFNQLVTKLNAFDGGCITDGTLEQTALNASDFSALYYGIQQGCALSYSDTNTISIDRCIASVNGALLKTATATTVTWGCSSCSAEVASTSYYVYIKTGSTGSTLTPLISTTAPNGDGYDNSGNKVLGSFYNNGSSNIDSNRIYQWRTGSIVKDETEWASYTPTFQGFGTPSSVECFYKRKGGDLYIECRFNAGTTTAAEARLYLPTGLVIKSTYTPSIAARGYYFRNSVGGVAGSKGSSILAESNVSYLTFGNQDVFSGTNANWKSKISSASAVFASGDEFSVMAGPIAIEGW